MIKLENVDKSFNGDNILENINLTLEKNNIYGLFGEMGAGKSTLLKIILGTIKPTKGVVVNEIDKSKFCFAEPSLGLYQELSVIENLRFWAKIHKVDKKNLNDLLAKFEIKSIEKKLINELSTGNKQKVNLACALMNDSDLIILDEPISNLDKDTKYLIKNILIEKSKKNIIIITSHQFDEVIEICTDVLVLKNKNLIINKKVSHLSKDEKEYIDKEFSSAKGEIK